MTTKLCETAVLSGPFKVETSVNYTQKWITEMYNY
jgi:hypothetical protein